MKKISIADVLMDSMVTKLCYRTSDRECSKFDFYSTPFVSHGK